MCDPTHWLVKVGIPAYIVWVTVTCIHPLAAIISSMLHWCVAVASAVKTEAGTRKGTRPWLRS